MKKKFINRNTLLRITLVKILILIVIISLIRKNETLTSASSIQNRISTLPVWLGIQILPINKKVAKDINLPFQRGLLVRKVISGSPAAEAGVKRGDIIRRVGNIRMIGTLQLRKIISKMLPGQKVRVVYIRNMKTKTVYVRLEQPPSDTLIDRNAQLVYGVYPAVIPPTDIPYPYFYFGEEIEETENELPENE